MRAQKEHPRHEHNESITFSLDSSVLQRLREEASYKDISVNTLVSQIAKDHVRWHSNAAKAGFISVRKTLISKFLEKHTHEEIRDIARAVAGITSKDNSLLLRQEFTLRSALDIFETWIKISGYNYSHTKRFPINDRTTHSFVIQHDMGIK